MERTKKAVKENAEIIGVVGQPLSPQYRWKKIGGGSFHFKNHIIKPGQTFIASVEEIPAAFLDLFECVDRDGVSAKAVAKEAKTIDSLVPEKLFEISEVEIDGELMCNVINLQSKKTINEQPLTLEEANALKTALEA